MRDLIKKGMDVALDAEVRVININDPRTEESIINDGDAHHVTQVSEDEEGNVFIYYAGAVPEDVIVED
jgi:hypothetical protein